MTATVIRGDALHLPLADETVDCVVTSPPYFGLRSYTDGGEHYAGQLGSEPTPAEYVDALLAATREMVRVLKPSGSLWINLGDKYGGDPTPGGIASSGLAKQRGGSNPQVTANRQPSRSVGRPKSLLGIPWRYALACIDQLGLILRAEVIWSKPNGLPESVTDRVRRSHEQWFHFVRQPRYYSAVDEIREAHTDRRDLRGAKDRNGYEWSRDPTGLTRQWEPVGQREYNSLGKLPGSVWIVPTEPLTVPPEVGVDHFAAFPTEWPRRIIAGWSPPGICTACGEGRRPDTAVDYISRGDKFAGGTAIAGRHRSGIRMGDGALATITGYVCACTPYTDHPGTGHAPKELIAKMPGANPRSSDQQGGRKQTGDYERVGPVREYHHDQWTPAPTTPAVVLDPFSGTGTVPLVADILGRHGIGVDLSADYCRLATWRTRDPAQRARAARVDKPPPVIDGQLTLEGMP